MDYEQWNNYTAIGYLKYALEHYNRRVAGSDDYFEECRPLTDIEISRIIACMCYAFDMKTLRQAYELV